MIEFTTARNSDHWYVYIGIGKVEISFRIYRFLWFKVGKK